MNLPGRKVCIVGGARIPFARSNTVYKNTNNRTMMTAALKALILKYNLEGKTLGMVSLGAVAKSSKDFSLGRECSIDAGLSYQTPTCDLQMACGTSLETSILVANKIAMGQIEAGVAGGVDSSSVVPIELNQKLSNRLIQLTRARSIGERISLIKNFRPNEILPDFPAVVEPRTGLSMGQHCELMVQEWKIKREDQDFVAFKSHQKAHEAYQNGFYEDLVFPFMGLTRDNNIRENTNLDRLGKLRPAFDKTNGTLTAGNSSAMTDGASAVLFCSEDYAKENGLEIQACLSFYKAAAVDYQEGAEGLLMAPVYAVPKLLKQAGLSLQDFDFYEIHEAFGGQVLCTLKAWENDTFCREKLNLDSPLGKIDREKLNTVGGSIAIGHPFAATGTRIIPSLAKLLNRKGQGRGLISICAAGGMGVTVILEKF